MLGTLYVILPGGRSREPTTIPRCMALSSAVSHVRARESHKPVAKGTWGGTSGRASVASHQRHHHLEVPTWNELGATTRADAEAAAPRTAATPSPLSGHAAVHYSATRLGPGRPVRRLCARPPRSCPGARAITSLCALPRGARLAPRRSQCPTRIEAWPDRPTSTARSRVSSTTSYYHHDRSSARALISPPVALTLHVFTHMLAKTGRPKTRISRPSAGNWPPATRTAESFAP